MDQGKNGGTHATDFPVAAMAVDFAPCTAWSDWECLPESFEDCTRILETISLRGKAEHGGTGCSYSGSIYGKTQVPWQDIQVATFVVSTGCVRL